MLASDDDARLCPSCGEKLQPDEFYHASLSRCKLCRKWWVKMHRAAASQGQAANLKEYARTAEPEKLRELLYAFAEWPHARKKKGKALPRPFAFDDWL